MFKIGFIGAGNMAQAMIKGWSHLDREQVQQVVYARHSAKAVAEELRIQAMPDMETLAQESDMIILATPPTALDDIANQIRSVVAYAKNKIVVSIMGGISLQTLQTAFGAQTKLVRALPNVNVAVDEGYIAMAAGQTLNPDEKGAVFAILAELGRVEEYSEAQFGAVSALAGSGPAFVAGFVQALTEAGRQAGLENETSSKLAQQTIQGTLQKMATEEIIPLELAHQVMTPGGSTAAGWEVMQERDINQMMDAVIQATMKKNAEFE